jgi:hypothetical protein
VKGRQVERLGRELEVTERPRFERAHRCAHVEGLHRAVLARRRAYRGLHQRCGQRPGRVGDRAPRGTARAGVLGRLDVRLELEWRLGRDLSGSADPHPAPGQRRLVEPMDRPAFGAEMERPLQVEHRRRVGATDPGLADAHCGDGDLDRDAEVVRRLGRRRCRAGLTLPRDLPGAQPVDRDPQVPARWCALDPKAAPRDVVDAQRTGGRDLQLDAGCAELAHQRALRCRDLQPGDAGQQPRGRVGAVRRPPDGAEQADREQQQDADGAGEPAPSARPTWRRRGGRRHGRARRYGIGHPARPVRWLRT